MTADILTFSELVITTGCFVWLLGLWVGVAEEIGKLADAIIDGHRGSVPATQIADLWKAVVRYIIISFPALVLLTVGIMWMTFT